MFDLTLNDIDIRIKCVHWTQAKIDWIKINKTLLILSSDKKIKNISFFPREHKLTCDVKLAYTFLS